MDEELTPIIRLCERMPNIRWDVRGEGKARFVYARSSSRAVELSLDSPGYFFEGWESADEDSDDAPAVSSHVNVFEELEILVREWLL